MMHINNTIDSFMQRRASLRSIHSIRGGKRPNPAFTLNHCILGQIMAFVFIEMIESRKQTI
jgi:hypothetical protein